MLLKIASKLLAKCPNSLNCAVLRVYIYDIHLLCLYMMNLFEYKVSLFSIY